MVRFLTAPNTKKNEINPVNLVLNPNHDNTNVSLAIPIVETFKKMLTAKVYPYPIRNRLIGGRVYTNCV